MTHVNPRIALERARFARVAALFFSFSAGAAFDRARSRRDRVVSCTRLTRTPFPRTCLPSVGFAGGQVGGARDGDARGEQRQAPDARGVCAVPRGVWFVRDVHRGVGVGGVAC